MPRLVRLYILQVMLGFGLSAVFVAALLWFDVGRLWHLVQSSEGGFLAVLMLWVFNGIVFAGAQFGIAVMRMGDMRGGGGGTRQPMGPLLPARQRSAPRPRSLHRPTP